MSNYSMRRFKNKLALWLGALCSTLAMIPLVSILYDVVKNGASSLNVDFLTSAPGVIGWRTTPRVGLTTAKSGVVTGILLAIARVAGETATLVFTILGSQYFFSGLNSPMDALPIRIYRLALLPYPYAQAQGWGAALVLILMVLVVNIGVRLATRGRLYTTRSRA